MSIEIQQDLFETDLTRRNYGILQTLPQRPNKHADGGLELPLQSDAGLKEQGYILDNYGI